MKRFTLSVLAATLAAFVAMNAHTIRVKAQVLGTGMAQTMTALTLSNTTNQLVLGTTNTVTISSTAPSASRTYTLPDAGAAATLGLFANAPAALQTSPQTLYVTSANYTNATTTFSTITGMTFAVLASTNYKMDCDLIWENNGGTVDYKLQLTGPASPTSVSWGQDHRPTVSTVSSNTSAAQANFSAVIDPNATVTATTFFHDHVVIGILNGANAGTIALQAALHTATGTLTIATGSFCSVQ